MIKRRRKEKYQGQVIDESLNRMQKYLEMKGVASNRVDLERKTVIEIVGTADNGKERLIVPEIRNKYGSDDVELDDGFQILMPFIQTGTIIIDMGGEKHYEEYEIHDVTDTKFSLKIKDYVKLGNGDTLRRYHIAKRILTERGMLGKMDKNVLQQEICKLENETKENYAQYKTLSKDIKQLQDICMLSQKPKEQKKQKAKEEKSL